MKRVLNTAVLIIIFTIVMFVEIRASSLEDNINSLIKWCEDEGGLSVNPDGDVASEWYVFAASRYGYNFNYSKYLNNLEDYVAENGLNDEKATEYQRLALVVLSCGGNPCSFAGMNLIKDGVYGRDKDNPLDEQGINGLIFGLLALDGDKYSVPGDAEYTREKIVDNIISKQLPDGGFSLYGDEPDADITAMVIQALAPYYKEDRRADVKESVEKALKALSEMQLENGGYESGGIANAESCVQVIVALCSLGVNPYKEKSFTKNGHSTPEALMEYQNEDGGFSHTHKGPSDWMTGSQVLNAMAALYRYENGMDSLYDLSNNDKVIAGRRNKYVYYAAAAVLICIIVSGAVIYGKSRKAKAGS